MNEKLINNYYDKILGYSEQYRNSKYIRKNKDEIKNYLGKIIEKNNTHILTDSILNYLSSIEDLIKFFYYLAYGTIEDQTSYLFDYFRAIIFDILNHKNSSYRQLQDYNTSLSTQHASLILKYINDTKDDVIFENKICFKRIVYIILSYCFINNRISDTSSLICKYINEPSLIIEDLDLNGIEKIDDIFIKRIISIIEREEELIK